jgi:uncharacterized 2Fe-2S/4Fe-4S cluster protein (DUF4445 family)
MMLLDGARLAGVELTSVCGGKGNCGQCRIQVLSGDVSPPTPAEKLILTEMELINGERLACCARVRGSLKINVPKASLLTNSRLQLGSNLRAISAQPVIRAHQVEVAPPALTDRRSDVERIVSGLAYGSFRAEPAVVRHLSSMARTCEWRLSVYTRDSTIVGIAPPKSPPLGLAVDLGTTKIAASLLNLETGEELAVAGALNPQIGYGEDVISRLNYVQRHGDGARKLAEMVGETLDKLLAHLLQQVGSERHQVADGCLVGNSAMLHLLLQLPTIQLASAPFVAASNAPMNVKAADLGLDTSPGAEIHILPCIGGFVGADHVAMIIATDMDEVDQVTVGIDIGTNTEIALAKPGSGHLSSASCASGPAFEGAHIGDGMRAASGAIEAVRLHESAVQLTTIDGVPPVGLCGSGIVDTIAELRRWRLVNDRGRFQKGNERLRQGRLGPELLLVPAVESGSGRDVVITQKDVNEIQLAKGAIRAGLDVLMKATETSLDEIEEVIIAGAFGSFLNIESALDIGLLPCFPNAVYRQVGNAAAVGAKWALISRAERERARQAAAKAKYIELTSYPNFSRLFALGMLFPADDQLRIVRP